MSDTTTPPLRTAAPPPQQPTPTELLRAFARVSLTGFGGVLPWARRMIVEERRWMTPEEFNEAFSLCQFLPGPNVVNLSIVFGARVGGANGALAALAGVVGPPIAIVLGLAALYAHFGSLAATQRALAGLAAAAGLIIAVAAKMATPLFRRPAGLTPLVTIGVFAAVGLFRFSLLWVVLAATPLSILAVWWWRR